MRSFIRGGDAYTPDGLIHDAAVLVEDGNIVFVGPRTQAPSLASVDVEIDADGGVIAAGFIDLQINGAGGRFLTEEPTVDAVLGMARTVSRYGCTAFLPTVITSAFKTMLTAVRAVHDASQQVTDGAHVLGVHLEGPFINPEAAWPEISRLRELTAEAGYELRERTALYPEYIVDGWQVSDHLQARLTEMTEPDGYIRPDLER